MGSCYPRRAKAAIADDNGIWCDSLEHMGLSQERRKLVLLPANFSWEWQEQGLESGQKPSLILRFALGTGDYATSILREVINLQSKV